MGILPKPFGANRHQIVVFLTMKPAQAGGGDLHDHCLIDKDHLCFEIEDVADKGSDEKAAQDVHD